MIWNRLNEFENYNAFEIMKITLKTVLIIVLGTCKTVSRKPCINREDKSMSSKFSYASIVLTRKMKLLEFVMPPYIYQYYFLKILFLNVHLLLRGSP